MLGRILERTETVYAAAAASLALGLFFTFVWAPHPWGWQGIDQYHDLAKGLARGEPFATTDVPWGYAYFAAAFYFLFGDRVWLPIAAQVIINATAPLLLYLLVRPWTTQRVAVMASLITGVFSFNNVYASTQASDALCTVLFLASLLALAHAIRSRGLGWFALGGLLAGIVPQFRPNMVLFPVVVAGLYVLWNRTARHALRALIYSVMVVVALAPWIIRNYTLTGLFLPTSTHGGVQLWYGTLQVGPYLESRAHNPRSVFESAAFHYTSLADLPLLVEADRKTCHVWPAASFSIHYWTDRDKSVRSSPALEKSEDRVTFVIPGQPLSTVVYYYFSATWPSVDGIRTQLTPTRGGETPFVFFVSNDHVGDLDRHGDIDDVFDFIRDVRASGITLETQNRASALLPPGTAQPLSAITQRNGATVVQFSDGSTLSIPAASGGKITDVAVTGGLAAAVLSARHHTAARDAEDPFPTAPVCRLDDAPRVNEVFYRKEPHLMRRYTALAIDNIKRDYGGFAAASAYRAVRLFIIRGTSDVATAQQFSRSRFAYLAGTVLSAAYFLVFLYGAWVAWRQRSALLWLLVPIIYVPLTICFVLTNMRYTVTMQPLMFVFVALSLVTVLRLDAPKAGARGAVAAEGR